MDASLLIITAYCERSTDSFWAEPLNAVTNLGFIAAAALLAKRLYRGNHAFGQHWDSWLLTGLIACIGVGSFLWHTVAKPWAEWLDVVPITLFISLMLLSFLRRILQLGYPALVTWFALFHVVNGALLQWVPAGFLNGSVFYLPPLVTMLILAVILQYRCHPSAKLMYTASLIFFISIVLRSLDQLLCHILAIGTHFLWHLLTSLTLYYVTKVLLLHDRRNT